MAPSDSTYRTTTSPDLATGLRRERRRVDGIAAAEDDRRQHEGRHWDTWVDEDGMLVVRGRLSPELGAVVQRALEAASERLNQQATDQEGDRYAAREEDSGGLATAGQRRADGTAGDRCQVVVHVEADALCEGSATGQATLENGVDVSAETSRRLACDAAKVVMRHDPDGAILDVGRKTRTIPPAIRRALMARDQRCCFPGCESRRCDAHHARHWADGGATRLDNLMLLCRRHHRAVHEEGYTVTLREGGEARFTHPGGWPLDVAPSAPIWTGTPPASTDRHLQATGIEVGPETAAKDWHGERLDLPWAIAVLHPRPASPSSGGVPAGTPGETATASVLASQID
jgi:5-methylcytosine-specific restriction endonuclease McrA